jgi:hypothetical protein
MSVPGYRHLDPARPVSRSATTSARCATVRGPRRWCPYRYLPFLAQPIVDTLRPFLAANGAPYVVEGDF